MSKDRRIDFGGLPEIVSQRVVKRDEATEPKNPTEPKKPSRLIASVLEGEGAKTPHQIQSQQITYKRIPKLDEPTTQMSLKLTLSGRERFVQLSRELGLGYRETLDRLMDLWDERNPKL